MQEVKKTQMVRQMHSPYSPGTPITFTFVTQNPPDIPQVIPDITTHPKPPFYPPFPLH